MGASRHYRLYGLTLASSLPLPCPSANRTRLPDVRLEPGSATMFSAARTGLTASHTLDNWFWCRRLGDGTRYLRWDGLFEFLVSPDGRRIRYRRLEDGTPDSFNVYLLGAVLSFSLLARGVEPLHATAVVVEGAAVGLLGDSGLGKSTLAAGLLRRGFPILTDDVLALELQDGAWTAHPGIPRIKLFPAMANRVLGSTAPHPRMNSGTAKLIVPLEPQEAAGTIVPLAALYVLSPPDAEREPHGDDVRIEPMRERDALLAIVGAAFNLVVADRTRRANQFTFASSLAASVPVRRLVYPRRLGALPDVCRAVAADVAALPRRRRQDCCAAGTATT